MAKINTPEASEFKELLQIVGGKIRHYRAQKGMTQKELAVATGTSPAYIWQVESGQQNVSLELMWKIARGLGLTLELLLSDGEIWEEPTDKSVRQSPTSAAFLAWAAARSQWRGTRCGFRLTRRKPSPFAWI